MSDQFDLIGVTPESWTCVDCGVNTAPGYPTRIEMEWSYKTATALAKLSGEKSPHANSTVLTMTPDDDDKTAEELEEEAALAFRIARYLELNGFANLHEAAEKGWGDTRPLRDCKGLVTATRNLMKANYL